MGEISRSLRFRRGSGRRVGWLLVVAVPVAMVVSAPASHAAPGGTVRTPVTAGAMVTIAAGHEPVVGTVAGTLMADGTVRPTASPSTDLPLSALARTLVLGTPPASVLPVSGQTTTDTDLVGARIDARSTTLDLTLWRVDLATGALTTRAVTGIPATTTLLGATTDSWVLRSAVGPAISVWPTVGGATTFAPTGLLDALTAGTSGIVYTADAGGGTTELRMGLPGAAATSLFSLDAGDTVRNATTTGGAVAWVGSSGLLHYWASGQERSTYESVLQYCCWQGPWVVPGGVALLETAPPSLDDVQPSLVVWDTTSPSTQGVGSLIDDAAVQHPAGPAWPSATIQGHPDFAATIKTQTISTWARVTDWVSIDPSTAHVSLVTAAPTTRLAAEVLTVSGSPGGVLVGALQDLGPDTTSAAPIEVVARAVGATSTPLLHAWRARLLRVEYWQNGTAPVLVAGSGRYSSTIETGSRGPTLVLRTDGQVTARVPVVVPGGLSQPPSVLQQSGPFTLVALGSRLRWSGPDGLMHGFAVSNGGAALDGARAAFATPAGVWLQTLTARRSASNPRRVLKNTSGTSFTVLGLAGQHLLALTSTGNRVADVDLAHGTQRWVRLPPYTSCGPLTGRVLACANTANQVLTLDTAARSLRFRVLRGARFAGDAIDAAAVTMAGSRVAYASTPDPQQGYPTQITLVALPGADGSVGPPRLLGPWAPHGDQVVTGSCWTPRWNLSEAATTWAVTLRGPASRLVHTWRGAATNGAITGVSWCPSRSTRKGSYRWTLSGSGPTGGVRDTAGTGPPAGVLRVS